MKYTEKSKRITEIIYRANGCYHEPRTGNLKWNSKAEFEEYVKSLGCLLKTDRKRLAGFVVTSYLFDGVCVAIPTDLADKILVLGDLP